MQIQRIKTLFLSMMLCATISSVAQNSMGVGTTTPNPNAVLELVSPTNNQGLLVPRLSTAQRTNATFTGNLTNAENGLMVFDTDEGRFYFWYSGGWNTIRNLAAGDMATATYDTDLDGKPDSAQYALVAGSIDGFTIESNVPAGAAFTDSQLAADVPFTPAGNITSTDVQSALEEIDATILTLGTGDMLRATYDADLNSIVDNAELVNGLTVETAVPAGAVFTDSQIALDVSVTPTVDLSSTNVQDALVELQGEIVSAGGGDMLRSTYDPDQDGSVNFADFANDAITVNGLNVETAVPAGAVFTDTQLSEAEVDGFVSNNGFLSTESDPTVPANIKDGVDFAELTGVPVNLDTDANDDFDGAFASLTGVPVDLADGDDVDDADSDPANEFQDLDFTAGILTLSDDPTATSIDISNYDTDVTDDFDGSFLSLTEVPLNLDTDATDDFDGSFFSLTDVPAGLSDGDDVGPTGTTTTITIGAGDFRKLEDQETGQGAEAGNFVLTANALYPAAELNTIPSRGKLIAPLNLPDGSVIEQITVVAQAQAPVILNVVEFGFGATSVSEGNTFNTPGQVGIDGALADYSEAVDITINNTSRQYALILDNVDAAANMRIYQVQITYSYNF